MAQMVLIIKINYGKINTNIINIINISLEFFAIKYYVYNI